MHDYMAGKGWEQMTNDEPLKQLRDLSGSPRPLGPEGGQVCGWAGPKGFKGNRQFELGR
ncbi:MAG: hypothetical protein ISS78_04410 [Phycisphaerae bacterium]|nr:hypothetical protein [Phycisphaerae bacterium]